MIINSFYENKKTTKRDLKNILGKYNFSAYNKIKNNILAIKLYFFFFRFCEKIEIRISNILIRKIKHSY